jgi:hypothetical protein
MFEDGTKLQTSVRLAWEGTYLRFAVKKMRIIPRQELVFSDLNRFTKHFYKPSRAGRPG